MAVDARLSQGEHFPTLETAYRALLGQLAALHEELAWRDTRCAGWTVRDLLVHLLGDAQRALVALHTPARTTPDVDAVGYWRSWQQPGAAAADIERRNIRIVASTWSKLAPLVTHYTETALAVLDAAGRQPADAVVRTQGHALTVDDLCSTLAVEATVHQLDLRLDPPPERALAEVRRVLDGLLGAPAPIADPVRYALIGTGREQLREHERELLGAASARFPLFG